MDIENVNSWVSQPDVCRCCLSTSGTWDLTASYITEAGIKEVFSDILQECFGISLCGLSEWGPRLACAQCVGQLRAASDFKKQVQQAERHFARYCDTRKEHIDEIPIKAEPDLCRSPTGTTEQTEGEKDSLAPVKPELRLTKHLRKKRRVKTKLKKKVESDDSDVPISELTKNNKIDGNHEESEHFDTHLDISAVAETGARPAANTTKHLSERRRVALTCAAVLRDTTACAFRHHKSWFRCFFCPQDFMQLNALRKHTRHAHPDSEAELKRLKRYPRSLQIDITNLECRCGTSLLDVAAMQRHLADAHGTTVYPECIADYKVDGSPYACHLCGRQFHVFRTLTTHLNEHYANCVCDVCGKCFLNSKRLKVHKRTHDYGLFPCAECGKVLKTKSSKANHMESHSKRVLRCQICLAPMKHYNDRVKHMSEAHNITHEFRCPICDRVYNIKHYLATHIRQTHGHKDKKCGECGMAFITNHGLKKHMLKHTGEKPFACPVCEKAYARRYTLREHMRVHRSEPVCGR